MKLLSLVLLSLVPVSASADRLDEVLAEMKKAGDALETLSADFEQTDHDFILEDQEVSTGKLFVKIPGRIRWEYATPAPKVLLVRDERVRLYLPSANQVHEFEQGRGGRSGGADLLVGFGKSNDKIAENYDASLVEETAESVVLKLVPKPDSAASLFTAIELTLDKKTWTPTRSVFHEPTRDRSVIVFQNMVLNGDLPANAFELDLPKDVQIVKQ